MGELGAADGNEHSNALDEISITSDKPDIELLSPKGSPLSRKLSVILGRRRAAFTSLVFLLLH